jgi:hypothetical protein
MYKSVNTAKNPYQSHPKTNVANILKSDTFFIYPELTSKSPASLSYRADFVNKKFSPPLSHPCPPTRAATGRTPPASC